MDGEWDDKKRLNSNRITYSSIREATDKLEESF